MIQSVRVSIVMLLMFLFTLPIFSQENTQDETEESIITIENALTTTYIQNEENETETIHFEGDVHISVQKGNSLTTIYADFIDFDRSRNSLYAEGSVIMEQQTDGEVTESLTADSLLFDTEKLEGFFNSGRVTQEQQESLNLDDGSVLVVSSELFARGSTNTVTFKNGSLTFCDDENPHWKINASRIWLLPGNEFAFANALLFVGPVPVMYFPFFYYPKDELVFNPSFGYRSREGFFIQSTTYIVGRKSLSASSDDSESDIGFNFMQQNQLKEQELQGLILRNLDKNATMPSDYLKIMADYYTTLGGMVGISGSFEPNTTLKNIEFDTRLGFTNSVFNIDGYPMYVSYHDNQKYSNYGWFFGSKLPFRYGLTFNTDIEFDDLRISIDMPFYSDPWFSDDFGERSESMDWIDFFLSGALTAPAVEEDDDADEITGFTWDISASFSPSTSNLAPWITDLSLTSLNSALVFSSQDAPDSDFENVVTKQNSPNREFFYPSQLKPINAKVSIQGTLFNWSSNSSDFNLEKNSEDTIPDDDLLSLLEDLIIPPLLSSEDSDKTQETSTPQEDLLDISTLPQIVTEQINSSVDVYSSYNINYKIIPEVSTLYAYSGTKPGSLGTEAIAPSDININDPKSAQIFFKSPINITGNLNAQSSLFSITNSFDFTPQYQSHHILSDAYYSEIEKEEVLLDDYQAYQLNLKNNNVVSIRPFQNSNTFSNTSINWNTSVNIIRTDFTGTIDEPEWEYLTPAWDDDSITSHNVNAAFEAKQGSYYQRVTLETNLPPLVDQYSATLALGFPFGTVTGTSGYKQESSTSSNWLFMPFKQSSSWSFFEKNQFGEENENKVTLRQSFEYDIENNTSETFSASLLWRGLQFSYTMRNDYDYTLDQVNGWVASPEKTFSPYSFAFIWNIQDYEIQNEDKTLSFKPGLSTSISWDMLIPTRSYFTFKPSISLEIKDLLKLTFSSETRNDQLVRYVQDIIGFSQEIPGEKNIFIDLLNSFAFSDSAKRQSSGFNIESFNVALEHDLHDWTLTSEFEIEPRIITESDGSKYFDYSPYFTLSILWKPMAGIKTTIEDDYGDFILNP